MRRRRLLLGEDLGKLAKGGGGFSWRRCRRCSETLPRPSPGDIAWKLTGEKDTKLQAMKFCSFPGFFHILAKSPGVPPTAFHSRPWPPVPIIWSEGESTTYCPRTIGADPLVRQRDFGVIPAPLDRAKSFTRPDHIREKGRCNESPSYGRRNRPEKKIRAVAGQKCEKPEESDLNPLW